MAENIAGQLNKKNLKNIGFSLVKTMLAAGITYLLGVVDLITLADPTQTLLVMGIVRLLLKTVSEFLSGKTTDGFNNLGK